MAMIDDILVRLFGPVSALLILGAIFIVLVTLAIATIAKFMNGGR